MQHITENAGQQQLITLSLQQIAELIIKEQKLHEGLYDLAFEFQIGVGAVGPSPETVLPGAMIGISRIGIKRAEKLGPLTVDASKINPVGTKEKKR